MFKSFEEYLLERMAISDNELHLIRSLIVEKKIGKHGFLLRERDVCNKAVFITKGLLRLYRVDQKGNEFTLKFAKENGWISDRESYLMNKPSNCNIEAIEDSEVLIWQKEDFRFLIEQIPALKQFMKTLVEKNQVEYQTRLYSAISSSTEEKYFQFITTHPLIFNRVPLHIVASYLGVSRETLSRIRKHSAHK